ncbi:chromosomal replication initiator protein DnaA [Ahrensia sp. R2A130]|nr:chromosomal replication initiator protein DnaA [Ahrensia sp. R2A130]
MNYCGQSDPRSDFAECAPDGTNKTSIYLMTTVSNSPASATTASKVPSPAIVAKTASNVPVKARATAKPLSRRAPKASTSMTIAVGPTVGARDVQKWSRVQAQLMAKLGPESFASWFDRCRLETISKSQLTISVPTTFLKSWIRTHYAGILLTLWQEQSEGILKVDIVVRSAVRSANAESGEAVDQLVNGSAPSASDATGAPMVSNGGMGTMPGASTQRNFATLPGEDVPAFGAGAAGRQAAEAGVGFAGSPLDPSFTFATFVEGASNRVACAAARSVAEADGTAARFNPLFLHANVGLGKTHLLQAIAWGASARNSGIKILYLTAEYFMWRFASAIRDQSALSFKESLRDIDLLLIDDMQFLQGKSIQQEFCHLLNALIDSAKQVVVAADRPPAQLESLDARVRSRLQGGVALEVGSPDIEMRKAMLELRYREARREDPNLAIPSDILDYVATRVASSGRDLEGAFNQLLIQHKFSDKPVEIEQIEKMLSHLVQSGEQRRVRVEDIQKVVSRHYNVSKNDLLSNRRTRIIVRPRQIAMYLSKMLTPRSLPEIGRRFGGRDHTTVLHAVRKIEGLLKEETQLAHEIELLKRLIAESA